MFRKNGLGVDACGGDPFKLQIHSVDRNKKNFRFGRLVSQKRIKKDKKSKVSVKYFPYRLFRRQNGKAKEYQGSMKAHKDVGDLSMDNPFLEIGKNVFEKKKTKFFEKSDEIF